MTPTFITLSKREPSGKAGYIVLDAYDVAALVDGNISGAQVYLRTRRDAVPFGVTESAMAVKAMIERATEFDLLRAIDCARGELKRIGGIQPPAVESALAILDAALASRRSGYGKAADRERIPA